MSKDWDYAKLSKKASKAGGPEKFVDSVFNEGKEFEKKEMTPKIIGGGIALLGVGYGLSKFAELIKKKIAKKRKEEEIKIKEHYVEEYKNLQEENGEEMLGDNSDRIEKED